MTHENTKKWVAANPKANPAWMPDRTYTDKMTLGKGKDRIDLYSSAPATPTVMPLSCSRVAGDVYRRPHGVEHGAAH